MAADPNSTTVPVAELEYEHSPLEDAVIRYRKQLILVGVLAVIGSAGYFGSQLWKESKHREAALAFTRAQSVGDLRSVAKDHAGQTAAGNALFGAAQMLAAEGKGTEAVAELNTFLTTYPQHPLVDLARFRLADYQMQSGATQEAVNRFREVANTAGSPYAGLALLRIADQAWQEGKIDEARSLYQELMTKHGGDRLFSLAEQRLKDIKLTAPELVEYVPEPAPQNPPPAGGTPGIPGEPNMAPPSAAALEKSISTPGLLGDDAAPGGTSLTGDGTTPPANEGDSLLPPPAIPAPAKP